MRVEFLLSRNILTDVREACERACAELQSDQIIAEVVTEGAADADNEQANVWQNVGNQETLYVTDIPEALHALVEREIPAVALSHAGNADADWSGASFIFSEPDEIDADSYVKAYERQTGQPWHILETKRLSVRETTVADVDRFYEIYADASMTKYMEGLFENPEDEKRYMRDYIKNVYDLMGFGVWTLILKETGEIIGRAGFSIRNGFDKPELGFLIGVKWQGQGYAQEALQAILAYGRDILGFETVQALVKEGNEESVHILKKLGFEIEGLARAEENIYGDSYLEGQAARTGHQQGTFIEMVLNT